MENCNCIVCAGEFEPDKTSSTILSKINITRFKICNACLEISDPENDYEQAKGIVDSYLKMSEAKHLYAEVKEILTSIVK